MDFKIIWMCNHLFHRIYTFDKVCYWPVKLTVSGTKVYLDTVIFFPVDQVTIPPLMRYVYKLSQFYQATQGCALKSTLFTYLISLHWWFFHVLLMACLTKWGLDHTLVWWISLTDGWDSSSSLVLQTTGHFSTKSEWWQTITFGGTGLFLICWWADRVPITSANIKICFKYLL